MGNSVVVEVKGLTDNHIYVNNGDDQYQGTKRFMKPIE